MDHKVALYITNLAKTYQKVGLTWDNILFFALPCVKKAKSFFFPLEDNCGLKIRDIYISK